MKTRLNSLLGTWTKWHQNNTCHFLKRNDLNLCISLYPLFRYYVSTLRTRVEDPGIPARVLPGYSRKKWYPEPGIFCRNRPGIFILKNQLFSQFFVVFHHNLTQNQLQPSLLIIIEPCLSILRGFLKNICLSKILEFWATKLGIFFKFFCEVNINVFLMNMSIMI